jgi:hypothetical protein
VRVDLLAEEAGLAIGFHDHDADAPMDMQIAQPCIRAGVGTSLISRRMKEGRRRGRCEAVAVRWIRAIR